MWRWRRLCGFLCLLWCNFDSFITMSKCVWSERWIIWISLVRKASLLSFAQQSKTSRNGSAVNAIIFSRSQCVSDGHTGNEFLSSLHTEFSNDFNAAPFRLSTFVTNSFIPSYIRAEFSNDFNAAPFRNQHSKRIRSSLYAFERNFQTISTLLPSVINIWNEFVHPFIHSSEVFKRFQRCSVP